MSGAPITSLRSSEIEYSPALVSDDQFTSDRFFSERPITSLRTSEVVYEPKLDP